MVPFSYRTRRCGSNVLLSTVTDTGNPEAIAFFDGASGVDVYITTAFTPNSAGVIHYRAVAVAAFERGADFAGGVVQWDAGDAYESMDTSLALADLWMGAGWLGSTASGNLSSAPYPGGADRQPDRG